MNTKGQTMKSTENNRQSKGKPMKVKGRAMKTKEKQ